MNDPVKGFVIRDIEPTDAAVVAAMANAFDQEDLGAESIQPFTRDTVLRDMTGAGALLRTHVAATSDGSLIGYASHLPAYRSESAQPARWLENLYVVPGWRRRGVADALMRDVAGATLAMNACALYWGVRIVNDGGKGFYDAIGAQREDAEILVLHRPDLQRLEQKTR